jgi:hypothetical protein
VLCRAHSAEERNFAKRFTIDGSVKEKSPAPGQWRTWPGRRDKGYIRKTRKYYQLTFTQDEGVIEYDRKSDGMYPLRTNDRDLSPTERCSKRTRDSRR